MWLIPQINLKIKINDLEKEKIIIKFTIKLLKN
jgi:hypothetical protein